MGGLTRMKKEVDSHLTDKIMKNLLSLVAFGIIAILASTSCRQNSTGTHSDKSSAKSDTFSTAKSENPASLSLLADTITYDAIIHNPNPEDQYTEQFLKHLKKEKLIDGIFDAVYSGKMKAYNIFNNKEMSIAEVKEIEKAKGFSRSKIGKVQFTESWFLEENSLSIKKKVIAMAFGYEHINSEGVVDDYKGMFRVYIK
jgi:hypothetical protein